MPLSFEAARDWVIQQWAENACCCVSFNIPGSNGLFVKGAFSQDKALEIINNLEGVDASLVDVIVSTPDERTSWFTWLDTKDIDGNRLKFCHRCSGRFSSESCPNH